MDPKPFQPSPGATLCVANATSASAAATLPDDAEQAVLYNSSATAVAYWRCRGLSLPTDTIASAVVPTSSNAGDMPIPPGAQVRVTVGYGPKKFSVIASAADGNLYITPGRGN